MSIHKSHCCDIQPPKSHDHSMHEDYRGLMRKFWLALILGAPVILGMFAEMIPALNEKIMTWHFLFGIIFSVLSFLVLFFSGRQFFTGAWVNLKNRQSDMDTLIALGTGSAWLYSTAVLLFPALFLLGTRAMYFDVPVLVTAFVVLGQSLEMRAKSHSHDAIKKLLEYQAKTACVIRNGEEKNIPVEQVQVGDILRVRPGEKIPVDGMILEGSAAIDESLVTGESMPVDKRSGENVIGGSLNQTGGFTFRATKVGEKTVLAQIIKLVEQAKASRIPIATQVDTISSYFVPVVVVIAVATFFVWLKWSPGSSFSFAIAAMTSVLVIACPCALGLATPISLMIGIGKAAENGILIRNGEALETASKIETLILDKTGTITAGKPHLTDVILANGFPEKDLLSLAAACERPSEHPLARAIVNGAKMRGVHEINDIEPKDFKAFPGAGAEATVNGRRVRIGNSAFLKQAGIATQDLEALETMSSSLGEEGKTAVFVAVDGTLIGLLALADKIKDDSKAAISLLQKKNIEIIMITGDNERTAHAIARQVGIEKVIAGASPQEKLKHIQTIQASGQKVGMAGDGINDAAALAQADAGFAIGAGADVAMEAADVILTGSSLRGIVETIEISRATIANIRQNLFAAFIYNILAIPIAAGAFYPFFKILLSPVIAGIAMAASSLTVVLNANRALPPKNQTV